MGCSSPFQKPWPSSAATYSADCVTHNNKRPTGPQGLLSPPEWWMHSPSLSFLDYSAARSGGNCFPPKSNWMQAASISPCGRPCWYLPTADHHRFWPVPKCTPWWPRHEFVIDRTTCPDSSHDSWTAGSRIRDSVTSCYSASYASTVLAVIVCLSVRLCVRPSVRHKSELYKDG